MKALLLIACYVGAATAQADYKSYVSDYHKQTKPVLDEAFTKMRAVVDKTPMPERIVVNDMATKLQERLRLHVDQEAEAMVIVIAAASDVVKRLLTASGQLHKLRDMELLSTLEDFKTTAESKLKAGTDGAEIPYHGVIDVVRKWIEKNPEKPAPDSWTAKYVAVLVGTGKSEAFLGWAAGEFLDADLRQTILNFIQKKKGSKYGFMEVPKSVFVDEGRYNSSFVTDVYNRLESAAELSHLRQLTPWMARRVLTQIKDDVSRAATQLKVALKPREEELGSLYQHIIALVDSLAYGLQGKRVVSLVNTASE